VTAHGVIDEVTRAVVTRRSAAALVIAVDGPDAAGKTTFADRLGERVAKERPVVRVQADRFENPRHVRHRRGADSPEGYVEDTYDLDALETRLLEPLRHGRPIVTATFDWETESIVDPPSRAVPRRAVVIVDGCFLLQRRLRPYFDLAVFLDADADARLERAVSRDLPRLGSAAAVVERFSIRYIPGFELYLERENPTAHADYLIDNSDVTAPVVKRRPMRYSF
jgi:uridine kinase